MPAGDITKTIVSRIYHKLGDHARKIVDNDIIIFDLIEKYQRELMLLADTTKQTYTFTILANTYEYNINPRVKTIERFYGYDSQGNLLDYDFDVDYKRGKIKIINDEFYIPTEYSENYPEITPGDIIHYECYIKPAYTTDTGDPPIITPDKVSNTQDPIIKDIYIPYIIDLIIYDLKGDTKMIIYTKDLVKQISMNDITE